MLESVLVDVNAHDVAAVVDACRAAAPKGNLRSAGIVDGCEFTVLPQVAMFGSLQIDEKADDLAAIVDPQRKLIAGAGKASGMVEGDQVIL